MTNDVKLAWNLYYKALQVAHKCHEGQVDKAGELYFNHPYRVSDSIINDYDFDLIPDEITIWVLQCASVAALHDVLEDTDCTEEYLREQGFSEDIIEGVKSVTRNKDESYGDFVKRASKNEFGKVVKLHDLEDNLDIKRLHKLSYEDINRLNKYLKWYYYLKNNE